MPKMETEAIQYDIQKLADKALVREKLEADRVRTDVLQVNTPTEKLRQQGAEALTDAELATIVVGGATYVDEAFDRIRAIGSLREMSRAGFADLVNVAMWDPQGADRLLAAFEIGRRACFEPVDENRLYSPGDVARYVMKRIPDRRFEEFGVLLLTADGAPIRLVSVARGTTTRTLIPTTEIFRVALVHNAAAIIVFHNHPSGNPTPSRQDVTATRELIAAAKVMRVPLLDHIVFGGGEWRSMAQEGELIFDAGDCRQSTAI